MYEGTGKESKCSCDGVSAGVISTLLSGVQVNVIPIIAKADTISRSELNQFKGRVSEKIMGREERGKREERGREEGITFFPWVIAPSYEALAVHDAVSVLGPEH